MTQCENMRVSQQKFMAHFTRPFRVVKWVFDDVFKLDIIAKEIKFVFSPFMFHCSKII